MIKALSIGKYKLNEFESESLQSFFKCDMTNGHILNFI